MEIRRANERVAEDDFSSIEVAIEVAGRAEDGGEDEAEMDNSDFVHGLPVPPENNLGVRVFNFKEPFCRLRVLSQMKRYCSIFPLEF